jgi:tRNA threonylcarbamoyladenosine biosynthesis protein TsaB
MMRVIALDTTTRGGSVALIERNRLVDERRGDVSRTHAELLPREILALLGHHGLRTSDVDLFAVAAGPGSFTGLRIGIATIQGLALVHRRSVAAVSALEALAQLAGRDRDDGRLVGVWMDAQRGEVFSALYRLDSRPPFDRARLLEMDPPAAGDPAATLTRWTELAGDSDVLFVGDGAVEHGDIIETRYPTSSILEPPPLAGAIGLMAVSLASRGCTVDPSEVRPLYVRRPDAERDRDASARRARDTKRAQERFIRGDRDRGL